MAQSDDCKQVTSRNAYKIPFRQDGCCLAQAVRANHSCSRYSRSSCDGSPASSR